MNSPRATAGFASLGKSNALIAGAVSYILGGSATAWLNDQSWEELVG